MKTIKELSETLNISKVALYKKLKTQLKHELTGHITKVNNITYIDDLGISIIAESLKSKTNNLSDGYLETAFNQVKSKVKTADDNQPINSVNDGFNQNGFNRQVKSQVNCEVNRQVKSKFNDSPCYMQSEGAFNQDAFNQQVNSEVNYEVNNQVNSEPVICDNASFSTVNQIINSFNAQLKVKDEQIVKQSDQIEKLNTEICEQNKHIRYQAEQLTNLIAQMNELQRNNQVLIAQASAYKTLESTDTKKSKNFFSRFFHKKQTTV